MKKRNLKNLKTKALDTSKLKSIRGGDIDPNQLPMGPWGGSGGAGFWFDVVMM